MSGPGNRASKMTSPGEPTSSLTAEGHDGGPKKVDLGRPFSPGSESSARPHTSLARKPGDLAGASLQQSGGRPSREGEKPHAVAHACEESDAAVVPGKPAKTWVTPVEPVEGRAAAKGKAAARNALPTQGGEGALTSLQRLGQKTKQRTGETFTNLLCHVKVPLLREAYLQLRADAASGVDGVTWEEYGLGLEERLVRLQDAIHRGSYHPQPVRRVHIPKPDGRTRPLGIPALEDKVVQQAVRWVLEPVYEAQFVGFSYGFRPGRGPHRALDALAEAIERKVNWVLDADIQAFFDTLQHEVLQRLLEKRIGDRRMVRLLMKWVRAGVMEEGVLQQVQEGTPQGGLISPLLANVYLHYALDEWVRQWRRTQAHGEMYVVRYADDFVMGFQREEDAHAMREALATRLAEYGLTLHPQKTRVLQFGRFAREDRQRRGLGKPQTFEFLGFVHIAGTSRSGTFQLRRRTSGKKRRAKIASLSQECRRRRHQPVALQHAWLCRVLVGHYRYYGVPTNHLALAQFRRAVERTWHRSLQHRSQRAGWTAHRTRAFQARYALPPPQLHHPWPTQRHAAR